MHRRHSAYFIDDLLRVLFATGLQVGVHQKIHGVKLMPLAAHVLRRFFLSGRYRANIGIDVVLPQTEPRKNMGWHVQGVWCSRCKLRIPACRRQAQLRHVGFVIRMDQIMRHARVIGLLGKQFLQHRGGSLSIGVGLIVVSRQHAKRVKRRCFVIIGMPLVNLLHRIRIRRSPLLISLPRVLIKFAQGCDVILFTRSGR